MQRIGLAVVACGPRRAAALVVALALPMVGPGLAVAQARGGGVAVASSATPTGNDISYPQCGSAFPAAPAFGIVGINDGLANTLNPCLGPSSSYPSYTRSELYWAVASTTGATTQPKASLYVNTADPGNVYRRSPIKDWPTSGTTPYGSCTTTRVTIGHTTYTLGQNSTACAWQYGYNKAAQDAAWLSGAATAIDTQLNASVVSSAVGTYPWWLDVETANTWQSGSSGQAMNVTDLQGMLAALQSAGATTLGAYSTASQWATVTGGTTTSASGSLYGLADWIPGATTLAGAQANCGLPPFTGAVGKVSLTQWAATFDNDYAC